MYVWNRLIFFPQYEISTLDVDLDFFYFRWMKSFALFLVRESIKFIAASSSFKVWMKHTFLFYFWHRNINSLLTLPHLPLPILLPHLPLPHIDMDMDYSYNEASDNESSTCESAKGNRLLYSLPPRPGFGTNGCIIPLVSNHFQVTLANLPEYFYRYRVGFHFIYFFCFQFSMMYNLAVLNMQISSIMLGAALLIRKGLEENSLTWFTGFMTPILLA